MDIMLLGLGDDSHTASLFPFNDVLKEDYRWAVAAHKEEGPSRVTLTLPVINNAGTIMFIVTGEKKAQAVYNVFFSSFHPDRYPAQAVKPAKGNLFWFIDKEAASLYLDQARKQK
jgi:6-phosphogluconolactonase